MATTYLQLSNELLRESNEVVLTSANFSSAVGIQQHVKDCVNRAYHDIVSSEPRWSFLATGESGATDPFYGNVYVETVAGTRWYELKASSSAITSISLPSTLNPVLWLICRFQSNEIFNAFSTAKPPPCIKKYLLNISQLTKP